MNHHAAILVKDVEAKEKLGETMKMLFTNSDEQNKLKNNIASLGFNNSTQAIVAVIKETVR